MFNIINIIKNKFNSKELTLEKKVDYLLTKNIDLYSNLFNIDTFMFLETDIIENIKKYKYINTFAIESQNIQLGVISAHNYKELRFYQWFTLEGKLISNKEDILSEFLASGLQMAKVYEFRVKLIGISNNSYANAKKIKPYYTEFNNIVEILYNKIKKK